MCVAELIHSRDRDQVWRGADWDSGECVDDEVTSGLIHGDQNHLLPVEATESASRAARDCQGYGLKNCRIASDVSDRVWAVQVDPHNRGPTLTRLNPDQGSARRDCEIEVDWGKCWGEWVRRRLIGVNVGTPDDQH
jgi:hypothetical protein